MLRIVINCLLFCYHHRPTSRSSGGNQNSNGVSLPAGLADDQSKDFDFEKTEMKYDSTGMFHWSPARNLEDCILVCIVFILINSCGFTSRLRRLEPGGVGGQILQALFFLNHIVIKTVHVYTYVHVIFNIKYNLFLLSWISPFMDTLSLLVNNYFMHNTTCTENFIIIG